MLDELELQEDIRKLVLVLVLFCPALRAKPLRRVLAVAGDHFTLVLVFDMIHYFRVYEVALGCEWLDGQADQVPTLSRQGAKIEFLAWFLEANRKMVQAWWIIWGIVVYDTKLSCVERMKLDLWVIHSIFERNCVLLVIHVTSSAFWPGPILTTFQLDLKNIWIYVESSFLTFIFHLKTWSSIIHDNAYWELWATCSQNLL